MPGLPIGRDIFERVAATFVEGAVAVALADQFGWLELRNTEWWYAALAGGGAAVLALVKSALATRFGRRSASLDPEVGLAPIVATRPFAE